MTKKFWKEKWRKCAALGVMTMLSVSLALGALTACGGANDDDDDDDETTVSRTDTQLIKNGDFEFFSEMDKELADKRAFISSPSDWSFTSGSPSSNTTSGIIDVQSEEWDLYTKSSFSLITDKTVTNSSDSKKKTEQAATDIPNAMKNWEKASVYDRLEFYDFYDDEIDDLSSSSEEKKFFNKYNYSVDFEDVENLRDDLGGSVSTHSGKTDEDAETGMLMIHNQRTSDGARGTGQYYTSSTTVTLKPGTAAKVSVWVKTQELYHFYEKNGEDEKSTAITRDSRVGGAYIGVTNTVGSTTLDQMQIKNIRSPYNNEEEKAAYNANNGWVQYTVFVRGSTFADSTFKLVLGLGQSTSSNRYEAVDGYALFDDVECTIMSGEDYERESGNSGVDSTATYNHCTLNSTKNEKIFDTVKADNRYFAYGLDLSADFTPVAFGGGDVTAALTTELSGSKTYYSKIPDNSKDPSVPENKRSLAGLYTYDALSKATANNGYLANFFDKDFKDAFPFADSSAASEQVVMLLSTNGAAYTATLQSTAFTVPKNDRKLVSFFVKTSAIRKGSGASATVIDEGGNKTNISAFDSTTLDTTDIDNNESETFNKKDLYNGWSQCFFFVENATEIEQTFTIELHYGTTSVATASASDYDDGYAAFAKFETCTLSAAQYNYVSTNSRAVKVSLSDVSKDISSFDSASRTSDIEKGFATPVNFNGVLSTTAAIDPNGTAENKVPDGVYTGLLNAAHADKYQAIDAPWVQAFNAIAGTSSSSREWWNNIFADKSLAGRVSNQPLVIINTNDTATDSYGYYLYNTATVAADSYQKISMRAKISEGATATFYLNDASDVKKGYGTPLAPTVPKVTYWYDDEGNIVAKDPASDEFNKKSDVLFYLETNGLYTQAGATDKVYYANLHNYDTDENGNLITSDDKTIAYHYNAVDNKYYCDYDEKKKEYSRPVENLPTTDDKGNSIVRYTAPESMKGYESAITIVGTGKWMDVSFFVHTGNAAKTYRLEIWAGSRDNKTKLKENAYYFFDSYTSTDVSGNYETLLNEKIDNLKKQNDISEDDNLPKEYALYSAFTFYDAPWYLRYDETKDEDNEGNPYANYTQSSNSEKLICLVYDNSTGAIEADDLSYSYFLDYSAYNVTVEKTTNDDSNTDNDTDDDTTTNNDSNIWLILSSVLLVVALLFAAAIVIGRAVIKHLKKTGRISSTKKVKVKKQKPVKVVKEETEAPAEEEKPANPDDPYNE